MKTSKVRTLQFLSVAWLLIATVASGQEEKSGHMVVPPAAQPDVKTVEESPVRAAVPLMSDAASAGSLASSTFEAAPLAPIISRSFLPDVLFGESDGTLWAQGHNFKAGFAAGGVTYVPAFGPNAPRNFPLNFRFDRATWGGRTLAAHREAAPILDRSRVVFDRGGFTEVYDLRALEMEQLFVFPTKLGNGEIRVRFRLDLDPEMTCVVGEGLVVRGEHGSVRIGRATVIDANGAKTAVSMTYEQGIVEIVVPAAVADAASYPLTIDPIVTNLTALTTFVASNATDSDTAYEATSDRWLFVYSSAFSATDTDIFSVFLDANGSPIASSAAAIDISSTTWNRPRVASNSFAQQFLVVAVVGAPGMRGIRGRTREATGSLNIGAEIVINEPALSGECISPDVGGDSNPVPPTYYAVTWERIYSPTDHDVHARLVKSDGSLFGSTLYVSNSIVDDRNPRISRSNGKAPAVSQNWTIVFERGQTPTHEVWGRQISWNGTLSSGPFSIVTGLGDAFMPVVSSLTDASSGSRRYLVAYRKGTVGSPSDIGLALCEGSSPLLIHNDLATLEGVPLNHRSSVAVETDGCRFTVAYTDNVALGVGGAFATTLMADPTTMTVLEVRAPLNTLSGVPDAISLASEHAGGKVSPRMLASFNRVPGNIGATLYSAAALNVGHGYVFTSTGLLISAFGVPTLGNTVSYSLNNPSGVSVFVLGFPSPPFPLCGVLIGVDLAGPFQLVTGPSFGFQIPCHSALIGLDFAIQGADLGGNGCNGLRVSNTVVTSVR